MAVGDPIRLGSAAGTRLIFQTGSSITTDANGIQAASIKAMCPDGANVFNYLPAAGATFNTVFGNSYLPNDFKVDVTGGGYQIDYDRGLSAIVTISFKRPDPTNSKTGRDKATLSVDQAIRFQTVKTLQGTTFNPALRIGIPEPVVTLSYNSPIPPSLTTPNYAPPPGSGGTALAVGGPIITGGLGGIGSTSTNPTAGFPDCAAVITVPFPGQLTGGNDVIQFPFAYVNPFWERTELKWEPVADQSFFSVTETWRRGYYNIFGDDIS